MRGLSGRMLSGDARLRMPGFTLVELMVTVAVLAILAAIAAPSFSSMIRASRSRTVAGELLATLNLARSEASRRGQPVCVCKSANGSSCAGSGYWDQGWIAFVNEDDDRCVRDGNELLLLVRQQLPTGVTVRANSHLASYVLYARTGLVNNSPTGGQVNNSGTFAVCSNGDLKLAQAVVVTRTRPVLATDGNGNGIPEVDDPDNDGLIDLGSCENP